MSDPREVEIDGVRYKIGDKVPMPKHKLVIEPTRDEDAIRKNLVARGRHKR